MPDTAEMASKRFVRSSDVLDAGIDDGEVVLLHPERGHYFGLKGPGQRIWELLETPATLADICTVLMTEFNVDEDICRKETAELISDMVDEALVEIATSHLR